MYLYYLFKYYIFALPSIYKLTNKSTNKTKSNINLTTFSNYFLFQYVLYIIFISIEFKLSQKILVIITHLRYELRANASHWAPDAVQGPGSARRSRARRAAARRLALRQPRFE
jgi:hypothetical protein